MELCTFIQNLFKKGWGKVSCVVLFPKTTLQNIKNKTHSENENLPGHISKSNAHKKFPKLWIFTSQELTFLPKFLNQT